MLHMETICFSLENFRNHGKSWKNPSDPSEISSFSHQDELRLGPSLPRDAAAEHLSLARSAVVNAAMAAQVRRSLEAWEAQRRWAETVEVSGRVVGRWEVPLW